MYFDELTVGLAQELAPVEVEEEEMLRFSRRYDNVPLHTDPEYAAGTPFGHVIAAGFQSFLLVWAEYLKSEFFGEALLAGKSQHLEWFRPVAAGDILTGRARITALTPRNARNGIAQLTIDVYNQDHVLVLTGITESIVKRREA